MRPSTLASRGFSLLAPCLAIDVCQAHQTVLVSRSSAHHQTGANGISYSKAISADGRYVFLYSYATDLILPDTNGALSDVVRYDRATTLLERASVSSAGVQGAANSKLSAGSASADGRFVVFWSSAINLVQGTASGFDNIYVHDFATATTVRIGNAEGDAPNQSSDRPCISGDARFVAFSSLATDFVPGDTNEKWDIYVHDRQLGTTVRASVDSNGVEADADSYSPSLSADGRYLSFTSTASNLVPNDTNGTNDVFVRDLVGGSIVRVSIDSAGLQGNRWSGQGSFSSDGRFVSFSSLATNLVSGDTNSELDAFRHSLVTGETTRVSVASDGSQSTAYSDTRGISSDGRFVPISSWGLAPPSPYGSQNVVLHDCLTASTRVVSLATDGFAAGGSSEAYVSDDGRVVTYLSDSTHLIPGYQNTTTGYYQVYVTDLESWDSSPFCFGTALDCPCANAGADGHGCDNSAATQGALLRSTGIPRLASDSLALEVTGELSSSLTIFLQGSETVALATFGDGVRCAGGALTRLYVKPASGGAALAPSEGEASVSSRSAALGDTIPLGATRAYQTYYRDPDATFCPAPAGNSWNASNGILVVWGP